MDTAQLLYLLVPIKPAFPPYSPTPSPGTLHTSLSPHYFTIRLSSARLFSSPPG